MKSKYPNYIFRLAGHKDYGPSGIDALYLEKVIQDGYIEYLGNLIDVREDEEFFLYSTCCSFFSVQFKFFKKRSLNSLAKFFTRV